MSVLPPRALVLAPMVELSHRALRELVSSFGSCDRYLTEMASASGYLAHSPYDRWFLDCDPEPERTAIQLYDAEPGPIIEAAGRLAEDRAAAGTPLAGLDLNFGCSAPQIEKAGGGVSWMKDPARAAGLVRSVAAAARGVPISAKMRLGYEESEEALAEFCVGLAEAGADHLAIHPRLKSEKFRRSGKWGPFAHAAAAVSALGVPVLANGDVRGWDRYRELVDGYGAAGVMIGREAARRPWIFALLRGKDSDPAFELEAPIEETGATMFRLIRERLPQAFHASRARRFFFYYCDNLSFGHHLRYAIRNAPDIDRMERLFRDYFVEVPSDRVKVER